MPWSIWHIGEDTACVRHAFILNQSAWIPVWPPCLILANAFSWEAADNGSGTWVPWETLV